MSDGTTAGIGTFVHDGRVFFDARQMVQALRERARRWDDLADDEEAAQRYTPGAYQVACVAAAVELADRADALDLLAIAAINYEGTDETHGI